MSQPDPPLWVRGLGGGLALVASWWLVHTETIRRVLGDAVAAVGLGVVAVFVIRGTHQSLGLWPERHARSKFSTRGAATAAAVAAGLIVLSGGNDTVTQTVRALLADNVGLLLLVVVGAVAWALGLGLVRQRPYAGWFGLAAALAFAPIALSVAVGWTVLPSGPEPVPIPGMAGFLFWVVADTCRLLITEEVAFRRMLIGSPDRAGFVVIVGAAVTSAVWPMMVGAPSTLQVLHASLIAVLAGGLYVLSRSLLVAALYHGFYLAALTSFFAPIGIVGGLVPEVPLEMIVITAVGAVLILGLVVREQGWIGRLGGGAVRDAAGD